MGKRAVVVARVSTDDQKHGFSLADQVQAGHKYAEAHGFDVVLEAVDDGVSGAIPFRDRPAGARAWAMLRNGQAHALIVQDVDRLSRDVVDLLVTVRELLRLGIEVHCLDLGRVTSEYDIMLVIRGWQGSDERAKIRERSLRGKKQKLTQGMIIGGRLLYGYAHARNEYGRIVNYEENPEQATIVRLMFEWYTRGDKENGPLAIRAIARRLSEAGIPTPDETRTYSNTRSRAASMWGTATVKRILSNPAYKGAWQYSLNATGDEFTIAIPALVTSEVWEAAQVQKKRNSQKATRNSKYDYLLRGIVRCKCGAAMSGKSLQQGTYLYYRCTSGDPLHACEDSGCSQKLIRAAVLEAAAWDAILNIITDPQDLEAKLLIAQQVELDEQEPKRAELEAVLAMLGEAESEAAQLATALTKATGLVEKVLQDKMTALDKRYQSLTVHKEALEVALAQRRLTDESIAGIVQFAQAIAAGMDLATSEDRRRVLDLFDVRVVVQDTTKATLRYTLAVAPSELHLSLLMPLDTARKRFAARGTAH